MSAVIPETRFAVRELQCLAGDDEAMAGEALDRLWAQARPRVLRQIVRREVDPADAEDLAQRVWLHVWRSRRRIEARSLGEWYALVRRIVSRELGAWWSESRLDTLPLDQQEVPDEDLEALDALVVAADDRRRLYEAADDLWLGTLNSRNAATATLATQLVLIDGLSAADVGDMLGVPEDRIQGWLVDHAAVARAAFTGVCWGNDPLAGYVLRPDDPLAPGEMDRIVAAEGGVGVWTAEETTAVLLRVRQGLQEDGMLRRLGPSWDRAVLERFLGRLRTSYPFGGIARKLRRSVRTFGAPDVLADGAVWRRVVFEYAVRHELPHRQILERAETAAGEALVRMDATRLNNWLSMGRLLAQLAEHVRREAGS